MANIFDEPKLLKAWCIKLNTKRISELLDEFVADHNENTLKVAQEIQNGIVDNTNEKEEE